MPRILIYTIWFDSAPISSNYCVTQPWPVLPNHHPPPLPQPCHDQTPARSPACHLETAALDSCVCSWFGEINRTGHGWQNSTCWIWQNAGEIISHRQPRGRLQLSLLPSLILSLILILILSRALNPFKCCISATEFEMAAGAKYQVHVLNRSVASEKRGNGGARPSLPVSRPQRWASEARLRDIHNTPPPVD